VTTLNIPRTIEWIGQLDGCVRLIDQTLLPTEFKFLDCTDLETLREAIVSLRVRGAPAIGVAGAMGLVLGIRTASDSDPAEFNKQLHAAADRLASSRPTAVNLFWALDRMKSCAESNAAQPIPDIKEALLREAMAIRDEDARTCRAIGENGHDLIPEGGGVLTHCNAGSLATAEYGTALALMYSAREHGRRFEVFADETRPLLQGSRLTAWELGKAGIQTTVLCDNMAAQLMKEGRIQIVITGADRIAANGDVANKIGTYGLAVLARAHAIPFYVAAPRSTFDLTLENGDQIPIETRSSAEIREGFGRITAPASANFYSPAFDVTPAGYLSAIVTEQGVIWSPCSQKIREFFSA
jgi:methylthioribose-1-phosphate isomerase